MQTFEGGVAGQGFGGFDTSSFSDIFEDFFGDFGGGSTRRTSNRGNDLRYDVTITLEEAYKGLEKMFSTQLIKNVLLVQEVVPLRDLSQ